jgi:hypothetical protein
MAVWSLKFCGNDLRDVSSQVYISLLFEMNSIFLEDFLKAQEGVTRCDTFPGIKIFTPSPTHNLCMQTVAY